MQCRHAQGKMRSTCKFRKEMWFSKTDYLKTAAKEPIKYCINNKYTCWSQKIVCSAFFRFPHLLGLWYLMLPSFFHFSTRKRVKKSLSSGKYDWRWPWKTETPSASWKKSIGSHSVSRQEWTFPFHHHPHHLISWRARARARKAVMMCFDNSHITNN